jgi:hypothetical protein
MMKKIKTSKGAFTLRECWGGYDDCVIDILDDYGVSVGDIKGSFADYTDEELAELVEENV